MLGMLDDVVHGERVADCHDIIVADEALVEVAHRLVKTELLLQIEAD